MNFKSLALRIEEFVNRMRTFLLGHTIDWNIRAISKTIAVFRPSGSSLHYRHMPRFDYFIVCWFAIVQTKKINKTGWLAGWLVYLNRITCWETAAGEETHVRCNHHLPFSKYVSGSKRDGWVLINYETRFKVKGKWMRLFSFRQMSSSPDRKSVCLSF